MASFPTNWSPSEGESSYTLRSLESGESYKLRAMTPVTVGYSLWVDKDGKPSTVRAQEASQIDPSQASINKFSGKPNTVKQFVAFLVWNYTSERFEVFETDKASIIKRLWAMDQDPDIGDLQTYDIKISKTGSGKGIAYEINSLGKSLVAKEITEKFKSITYTPTNFFTGGNPLTSEVVEEAEEVASDVPF